MNINNNRPESCVTSINTKGTRHSQNLQEVKNSNGQFKQVKMLPIMQMTPPTELQCHRKIRGASKREVEEHFTQLGGKSNGPDHKKHIQRGKNLSFRIK